MRPLLRGIACRKGDFGVHKLQDIDDNHNDYNHYVWTDLQDIDD